MVRVRPIVNVVSSLLQFFERAIAIISNIVLNIQFDYNYIREQKKSVGTKEMFHQRTSPTFNMPFLNVCWIFRVQAPFSDAKTTVVWFPGRNPSSPWCESLNDSCSGLGVGTGNQLVSWLVTSDPYYGLLQSPYNWVV